MDGLARYAALSPAEGSASLPSGLSGRPGVLCGINRKRHKMDKKEQDQMHKTYRERASAPAPSGTGIHPISRGGFAVEGEMKENHDNPV